METKGPCLSRVKGCVSEHGESVVKETQVLKEIRSEWNKENDNG
jgi:hypothetical protein